MDSYGTMCDAATATLSCDIYKTPSEHSRSSLDSTEYPLVTADVEKGLGHPDYKTSKDHTAAELAPWSTCRCILTLAVGCTIIAGIMLAAMLSLPCANPFPGMPRLSLEYLHSV